MLKKMKTRRTIRKAMARVGSKLDTVHSLAVMMLMANNVRAADVTMDEAGRLAHTHRLLNRRLKGMK